MDEYSELMARQRTKVIWMMVIGFIIFILCVGAALSVYRLFRSTPEPTATPPATVGSAAFTATPTPIATSPVVTITPTLMDTPPPTQTPMPISTATLTPEPLPTPLSDPQGDVVAYESGNPVEGVPAGVDIRAASVGADLRVVLQPAGGVPAELAAWATEDEALLWISLYDPVPDPPTVFTDWLFVMDLDGDVTTGRPAGAVRINPDLGYEVAIGVSYNNVSAEYESYFLVWDQAQQALVSKPDAPRFVLAETRTLIGLALPLATLTENVEQTASVTLVPGDVKGRAAVQSYAQGQKVIDFCPNLPD